jgi:hypothetical protein
VWRFTLRQCLFLYQYWIHPVFGFMSSRLQTWFPFPTPIYRNAREWLARQMDRAGMHYRRHDNCFTGVEDFARAQALLDEQRKLNGAEHFDPIAPQIHPLFAKISAPYPLRYRWTCSQSEWAMDLVFGDAAERRRLYLQLPHLGMVSFSSPDGLRFMGNKVSRQGTAWGKYELPLTTELKVRVSGPGALALRRNGMAADPHHRGQPPRDIGGRSEHRNGKADCRNASVAEPEFRSGGKQPGSGASREQEEPINFQSRLTVWPAPGAGRFFGGGTTAHGTTAHLGWRARPLDRRQKTIVCPTFDLYRLKPAPP